MKIEIRISDSEPESVVITCREHSEQVLLIESAVENALRGVGEMMLHIDGTEYYVPKNEILFFESYDGKVYAHTSDRMYLSTYRLFELEDIMPSYFVRISKSVVVNIKLISSLHRELTGNGELTFKGCGKKTYFSRGYYKVLKDKIEEVRFSGK